MLQVRVRYEFFPKAETCGISQLAQNQITHLTVLGKEERGANNHHQTLCVLEG